MATAAQLQAEFYRSVSDPIFGEDVVYVAGGVDFAVKAHVYRRGISAEKMRFDHGSESRHQKYDCEIRISSQATQGRPSVSVRDDYVKLAKDIGGAVIKMRVAAIVDQDPGTWRLGLTV